MLNRNFSYHCVLLILIINLNYFNSDEHTAHCVANSLINTWYKKKRKKLLLPIVPIVIFGRGKKKLY